MTDHHGAVIDALRGRIIVSVQADRAGSPLDDPPTLARIAAAAVEGGAGGIRCGGVSGPAAILAISDQVDVPVIGLWKVGGGPVYITPSVRHAIEVASSGAPVIAIDGTGRARVDGSTFNEQAVAVHRHGAVVMADLSSLDDLDAAMAGGADMLATTLAGYVDDVGASDLPDLGLVESLARRATVPVIAEGRYCTLDQVRAAFDAGAWSVVVGKAITSPTWLTKRFLA